MERNNDNTFLNKINSYSFYWSGKNLEEKPDDLDTFAGLRTRMSGYKEQPLNPQLDAPIYQGTGGVIYFENNIKKEEFNILTKILQLPQAREYAAITSTATNPIEFGYLTQIRTISKFGLRFYYDALNEEEYENPLSQELTITELYWEFIEEQRRIWGISPFENNSLIGKFGGCRWWSEEPISVETLSFGIMIESSYFGISRIWSRAFLLTKRPERR